MSRRGDAADVAVADVARLIARPGDWRVISPTPLQPDDRPRQTIAVAIGRAGEPERQVVVRIPFEDVRAEDVLTAEARQLPRDERGLVIVDLTAQPTALSSWPSLVLGVSRKIDTREPARFAGWVVVYDSV